MHVYISDTNGSLTRRRRSPCRPPCRSARSARSTSPENAGPGHVIATDAVLPIAGDWTFTITARYSEFDQTCSTRQLMVR